MNEDESEKEEFIKRHLFIGAFLSILFVAVIIANYPDSTALPFSIMVVLFFPAIVQWSNKEVLQEKIIQLFGTLFFVPFFFIASIISVIKVPSRFLRGPIDEYAGYETLYCRTELRISLRLLREVFND